LVIPHWNTGHLINKTLARHGIIKNAPKPNHTVNCSNEAISLGQVADVLSHQPVMRIYFGISHDHMGELWKFLFQDAKKLVTIGKRFNLIDSYKPILYAND
jgi:hypothetical protein